MKRLYVRRLPLLCPMSKLSTVIFIFKWFIYSVDPSLCKKWQAQQKHKKYDNQQSKCNRNTRNPRRVKCKVEEMKRKSPRIWIRFLKTHRKSLRSGRETKTLRSPADSRFRRQALSVKTWIRACRCKRYWTNPTHAARSLHLSLLHHIPVSLRFTFKYSNKRGIAVYRRVAASST